MEDILLGTTDRTALVFIADPASTDGSGKTGLTHADLTVSYTRVETDNDVVVTDVTSSLSTLTNLTDAHADWGVKEVSSTLAPGLYRIDIADAVFASGAWTAVVYVMVTSSAASATPKAFRLVSFNALDGVRAGLTALPNAAADAAGGLPISDAGGLDLDAKLANTNEVTAARMGALTDWIDGGRLDLILDNVKTDTGNLVTRITSTLFAGITSMAQWLGLLAGKQTGDTTARTELRATGAASGTYDETTDSLEANRDNIGTAGAGLTAADDAVIMAIGALNNITAASVWAVGTRELTAGTNIVLAKGVGVTGFNDLSAAQVNAEADTALADYDPPTNAEMEARTLLAAGYATPTNITTVGAVSGAVASVTGAVGSVTGNVGGNVTGSVGSVLGGINTTGGTITTLDALDTAQDSQHNTTQTAIADVPTNAELATALGTADDATLAAIATLQTYVDTEVAAIKAKTDNLPTDPADASDIAASFASIASSIATLQTYVDTEVAAIKAKTDSLTFTVAGQVDSNVQYVNDTQVDGTGATGNEWGPV